MLSCVSAYYGGTLSQIQDAREGKKFPRAVGEGNTVGSPARKASERSTFFKALQDPVTTEEFFIPMRWLGAITRRLLFFPKEDGDIVYNFW